MFLNNTPDKLYVALVSLMTKKLSHLIKKLWEGKEQVLPHRRHKGANECTKVLIITDYQKNTNQNNDLSSPYR